MRVQQKHADYNTKGLHAEQRSHNKPTTSVLVLTADLGIRMPIDLTNVNSGEKVSRRAFAREGSIREEVVAKLMLSIFAGGPPVLRGEWC